MLGVSCLIRHGSLRYNRREIHTGIHGRVMDKQLRDAALQYHRQGEANLLIMPSQDAANIAYNLLKIKAGDGITIGSILLGANKSAHILTSTATVRRIVNMSALAVAGVNTH